MSKFGGIPVNSKFGGVPVSEEDEKSYLQIAANIANDVNYGLVSVIPGLQYFTSKIGIGEDIPRGEEGEVTPGQGAARMVGMSATMGTAALAGPMRAAAAGMDYMISQTNIAREGVQKGFGAAVDYFLQRGAATAAESPAVFLSAETASAASAGAVGQAVYNETGSPATRMAVEMITGGTVGALPQVLKVASAVAPTAMATRVAINRFRGQKTPAGIDRAAKRVQQAVEDPKLTIRKAEQANVLPEAKVPLAARAEEPELLALEKSVMDSSDRLSAEGQKRMAEINAVIRSAMGDVGGDVSAGQSRQYLDVLVEERIRAASVRTQERLAALRNPSREVANRMAREELDSAYTDALKQERELWGYVPETVGARISNTERAHMEIWDEVSLDRVAQGRRDIPADANKYIGYRDADGDWQAGLLDDAPTIKELQTLRSTMLDSIRREKAKPAPNRRKIGHMRRLEQALLDDMAAVEEADEALKLARGFSKDLNERFRQGDVGRLLGYEVTGEAAVPPVLTLEKTVGRSGMAAAESVDSMLKASEDMAAPIQDFLTTEFMRAARRGGDFNPAAAERYLAQRQDVLSRFPALTQKFQQAIDAGNLQVAAEGLKKPGQSAAALMLRSPVGREVDRLLSSPKPAESAKEIMSMLSSNAEATSGFRKGLTEWLLRRSTLSTLDAQDAQFVSGRAMQELMQDPAVEKVMREVLSPQQLKRVETIKDTAIRLDRMRGAKPSMEGLINDAPGVAAESVRRVLAAGLFRNIAQKLNMGGTVQIPGQGVKFADRLAEMGIDPAREVLVDAVMSQNDDLMKALLLNPRTLPQEKFVKRQINAWMYAAAAQYGIDLTEE